MISFRFLSTHQRCVKLFKFCPNVIQTASITGRGTRGEPLCLMPPFPYEKKRFRWYQQFFDNTMVRISQENAKLIVVEGPIGVGKSAFCKALAEQFDMVFMPQPTMDDIYILPTGYDLRQHDCEVPESVQTFDHKNFCVSPRDRRVGIFQIQTLQLKFMQYVDALCHIFNTGQGVILERNFFSDFVFIKAMHDQKFVSTAVKNAYFEVLKNTRPVLKTPHLIIYLDIPVPVVQERIRTRNYSYEQNSPALTTAYLESLEKYWKLEYLKEASKTSEILVYNWTDGGDVEIIIEDIEKIDFDIVRRDDRFCNWRMCRGELHELRALYTNKKIKLESYFKFYKPQVPEFNIPEEDVIKWNEILRNIPDCKFDTGYNYKMGDSIFNILFKVTEEGYRRPKFHLRYYDDVIE